MTTINAAATIIMTVISQSAISQAIWKAAAADPRTRMQAAWTTAWRLDGAVEGEAIGLVTGYGRNVVCYAIVRIADRVHIVESRGMDAALRELGYESKVHHPDPSDPEPGVRKATPRDRHTVAA